MRFVRRSNEFLCQYVARLLEYIKEDLKLDERNLESLHYVRQARELERPPDDELVLRRIGAIVREVVSGSPNLAYPSDKSREGR